MLLKVTEVTTEHQKWPYEWLTKSVMCTKIICVCNWCFSLIQIYLDICQIHSLASEYIKIFVPFILGYPNILQYFFEPLSCVNLPYADNSWSIWTIYEQFEFFFTYLSKDTQIWMIDIPLNVMHIFNVFKLVAFSRGKHVRIFVWSNLGHQNILWYLFGKIFDIWIYLDVYSAIS